MRYANLIKEFFALRRSTSASREEIDARREVALRALLVHAFDHAPYYRQSFEEAGFSRKDMMTVPLSSLPATDKAQIMEHFDEVITVPGITRDELVAFDEGETDKDAVFKESYHVVHSSGSTGKPGYFVYDDAAWGRMTVGIVRGALWGMSLSSVLGLLLRRPRVLYVAAADGRYGGAMAVSSGVEQLRMAQLSLDINTPLSQWSDAVRAFKPTVIIGYPSAIKILGDLVKSEKVDVDIERIIACGEPLSPGMRSFFEHLFVAPVVNFYGASESLALGVEVDPAEGMYLFDDLNWIEVDESGVYLTSLYNHVQPLIRYRLSDKLAFKEVSPENACCFARIESVRGRSEDLLWFEDESGSRDFLHPLSVEGFNIEGLRDYQFCKTSSGSFEMTAEVSELARQSFVRAEMQRQMRTILEIKGLSGVGFDVRFVDAIDPDPLTGKKRLIVPEARAS